MGVKRILLVLSFLFFAGVTNLTYAQQDPQFTQYMYNQLYYNPAYAGVMGASNFTFVHRSQWAGYQSTFDGGGAPNTQVLSFNTPIYKLQSGFGAYIMNDNLGPLNNLTFQGSYAYHLTVKNSKLSFGIKAGIISQSIDFDQYRWADPNDPYRIEGKETQTNFDLGFGVYYRSEKLYLGVGADHLLQPSFSFGVDQLRNEMVPNINFIAGYDYAVTYNLVITPSMLIKTDINTFSFDLSVIATYNERLWGGVSFRQSEAAIFMLGYSFLKENSLKVGYSFDYIIQNQEAKQATSHELMLSYSLPVSPFGGRKIIRTPRFRH